MTKTFLSIREILLLTTFIVTLGGLIIPMEWIEGHLWGFAFALMLGGVPHGASDYIIFRQLEKARNSQKKKSGFILFYLLIVIAYGLLWWVSPVAAFGLFLLISAYHFGQSNWNYVQFPGKIRQVVTFISWGSLVIGVPVLLYHQEATMIIAEITGFSLKMDAIRWPAIFLLLTGNAINVIYLLEDGLLSSSKFRREIVNLLVLTGLFAATPLLIGFGIYFVFWHSLGSVRDQISVFKKLNSGYNIRQYIGQILPFSLIAFGGLGFLYWLLGEQMNLGLNLGVFFLFISIITVPHSILMDQFYLADSGSENNVKLI